MVDYFESIDKHAHMFKVNDNALDPNALPSTIEEWNTWMRITFKHGNTQVFVKLGTWMLLRFQQLAMLNLNDNVNGIVMSQDP